MLLYETIQFPSDPDSTRWRVDIHYRIDREFFIPIKNEDTSIPDPFLLRGEVLIEMVDSTGITAGRALDRIEAGEPDAERRPMGEAWQEGIATFSLRPGPYRVHLTVDDLESRRSLSEKQRLVRVGSRSRRGLTTASPMFIAPVADSGRATIIAPLNFGGDILFGSPAAIALVWSPGPGPDSLLHATFTLAETPAAVEDQGAFPALSPVSVRIMRGVTLRQSKAKDLVSYEIDPTGSGALAIIPFPAEQLLLRSFALTLGLSTGAEHHEVQMKFRLVWPTMPFSLKDIDFALDALRYITTEHELDSLRSGSMEARRKNLEEFWRKKDRTPTTARNEVETEYYRRVDYASRNFGTIRQPDGFRSDRGRIYVLYGPPGSTERSLDPDAGYKEVWVYARLNKTFVFVDRNKSGNYLLETTPP
jgi:GWxTD domain-containing protein